MENFQDSVAHFMNDFFSWFSPTILDFVVVVVLLISAILAFVRGFTRETLGLVTWVGSFLAGLYIHPYILPHIAPHLGIGDSMVLKFVVGGIVFIIFFVSLWFASISISSIIKSTPIASLDRGLGFLFGVARGFVIVCLIFAAYLQTQKNPADMPDYVTHSIFYPTLSWGAETTIQVLPGWANRLQSETQIQNRLIPTGKSGLQGQIENKLNQATTTAKDTANTAKETVESAIQDALNTTKQP